MELKIRYSDMQLPHVFIHFLAPFMWFPHENIAFPLFIFRWVPKRISRWPDMQLPHVFIAFVMRDHAFPHVFITFLAPPSFLLGAHWGPTCNLLMCLLHFSFVIKHFLMCLVQFGTLQGSLGVSFLACWRGCGASWASFRSKMEPETWRWGSQNQSWLK